MSEALRGWVEVNAATALVLVGALLADRVLAHRVGAAARLWLFVPVLVRALLPAGWSTPVGIVGVTELLDARSQLNGETAGTGHGAAVATSYALLSAAPSWVLAWVPLSWTRSWMWMAHGGGMLVLLAVWSWRRWQLGRALRGTRPVPIDGGPTLHVHPVLGPLVAGVWRPRIVLPATMLGPAAPETVACVVAQEAAHVARRDPWLAVAVQLVCIAAWPALPVWIAARRIRTLMEVACDERAVRASGVARRRYAEVLVDIAEGRTAVTVHVLAPSFGSDLRARLRALAHRRRWAAGFQGGSVAVASAILIACSGAPEMGVDGATAGKRPPVVTVTREGGTYVNNRRVGPAELEGELRRALQEAGTNEVFFHVDSSLRMTAISDVFAHARRAGARIYGLGVDEPPPPREPAPTSAVAAAPTASGAGGTSSYQNTVVSREIRARMGAVKACYERALRSRQDAAGKLMIRLTISATGAAGDVSVVGSTVPDDEFLKDCLRLTVERWRFPAPPNAEPVAVTFPVVLTPTRRTPQH